MTKFDLAVVLAYFAGMFAIGIHFSRRQESSDAYFLVNRRVPWFLAGISVIATLLSTASYLATPGEMIRYGLPFFTASLCYVFVIPTVNRVIIPFLMRLRVTSIYEYLEQRFSATTRSIAALTFVTARLIWIGLIIYTAAFAASAMTGLSMPAIILCIGILTTFYASIGGMSAVLWSDLAQFVILFGGALVIPIYVAWETQTGPADWWKVFSQTERANIPIFSLDPTMRITLVGIVLDVFIWNICTHGADQVAAQRYLSTPSAAAARRSVWVYSLSDVALNVLLMTCGLSLFYYYFHQSSLPIGQFQADIAAKADSLLPDFVASVLPSGASGLMLAGMLAAAMSSLSSGINSITAVISSDFLTRLAAFRKQQGKNLLVELTVAGVVGALGILLALWITGFMKSSDWNLVDLMIRTTQIFVAPLGALFFIGILLPRVGASAVITGFWAGVVVAVLISFSGELLPLSRSISFMWIQPVSFVVCITVAYLVSFIAPRGQPIIAIPPLK
ncbi:MAG: sodium/solute symporter [Acidobacteria bacterium]|nr:sodium/solute symporter [Acidobacteriota bacterium]